MNARAIVEKYVKDIFHGAIVSSVYMHGWATEALQTMDGWHWEDLDKFYSFANKLRQATGSNAGQPLYLLPWQYAIAAQLLCDRDCKALLVVVARGAGKTELAAALLAYSLTQGNAGQTYNAVAPNLRTASIVYDRLRTMCRQVDPDVACSDTTAISHQGGWIRSSGSTMRALPCTETAMDGLTARLIVADEVARMSKGISRVITGLGKDARAQLLCITTPDAHQRLAPIWAYWSQLQAHYVHGEAAPAGWVGMMYGLDIDDDALDSEKWIKAQPSLGHTVTIGAMRSSVESMMSTHDPEAVAECDMQILARHNDRLSGAIDLSVLDRQMCDPIELPTLRGAPAVIAIDLARGASIGNHANLSSLCLAVWDAAASIYHYRLVHWWAGQNIEADERRCRQPLRRWVAEGALRQMSTEIHDMGAIEAVIQQMMKTYSVRHVGVDPLAHQESALVDWRRRGITVTAVDQGIKTMAPAWALWTDGLRGKTISHAPDPVLRACLSATRTIQDNVGNVRPVKGRSASNIDAVVASCMAAVLCERFAIARGSSYECAGGIII